MFVELRCLLHDVVVDRMVMKMADLRIFTGLEDVASEGYMKYVFLTYLFLLALAMLMALLSFDCDSILRVGPAYA